MTGTPQNSLIPYDVSELQDGSAIVYSWTLTSTNDTAMPARMPEWSERSVHMWGTWGGATAIMEGSNDLTAPNPVDFEQLHNFQGTAIALTANGISAILESTYYIRPRLSVDGTGASVTVNLLLLRNQPSRVA